MLLAIPWVPMKMLQKKHIIEIVKTIMSRSRSIDLNSKEQHSKKNLPFQLFYMILGNNINILKTKFR
jgi:hypothetical protein